MATVSTQPPGTGFDPSVASPRGTDPTVVTQKQALDYTLPSAAVSVLENPEITTRNVIVMIHHEGDLLFGKRAESLDEGGKWSVVSGGMESYDNHPIDAALRELREETGYSGDFSSVRVIGARGIEGRPECANIYVVVDVPEKFKPSAQTQGEHGNGAWENTAWEWAPAARSPEPRHPGLQATQERFFEDQPIHYAVPADGVLPLGHGTASWFSQFSVSKAINGRVYGDGVYGAISNGQREGYARRAQDNQSELHGQYHLDLEVKTAVPQGGFIQGGKPVSPEIFDRVLTHLMYRGTEEATTVAQKLLKESRGQSPDGDTLLDALVSVDGRAAHQTLCNLGIKGRWIPGFCYVAFDPRDVNIIARHTIKAPAGPERVLEVAENTVESRYRNAIEQMEHLRDILSVTVPASSDPKTITKQVNSQAQDALENLLEKKADELGLSSLRQEVVQQHQKIVNDFLDSIGSRELRTYLRETFPNSTVGRLCALEQQPLVMQDPETFLRVVVGGWAKEIEGRRNSEGEIKGPSMRSMNFAVYYERALLFLYRELSSSGTYLRDSAHYQRLERASSAKGEARRLGELLDYDYPNSTVSANELQRAAGILKEAAIQSLANKSTVTNKSNVQSAILDVVQSYDYVGTTRAALLALQIATNLSNESLAKIASDENPVSTSGPQGKLSRFIPQWISEYSSRKRIEGWLKNVGASAPDVLNESEAIIESVKERKEGLSSESRRLEVEYERVENLREQFDRVSKDYRDAARRFQSNVEDLQVISGKLELFNPLSSSPDSPYLPANNCTIAPDLTFGSARDILSGVETGRLDPHSLIETIENSMNYFSLQKPSERAILFAADQRVMQADDLHPSWTEERLAALDRSRATELKPADPDLRRRAQALLDT